MIGGVFVRPFNGCCFAIVGTDVAHNFAIEIFDRTEDAAGDEVSLDFGEPDFDLVEPGGVSGRVMNTHLGVTSEKITDRLGLMGAQVITDDVEGLLLGLASHELFQKRHELCASVAGAGLANHFAGAGMECRVQRQRAVTVILKAVSFGPARGQGQNWVQAVKRLDGTLFVNAEDRRVKRWLEVKSNDVGSLLFKLWVGAGHVAPESMGLNPGASPDAGDSTVRNVQMPSQFAGAPMSRTVRRRLLSSVENLGFL